MRRLDSFQECRTFAVTPEYIYAICDTGVILRTNRRTWEENYYKGTYIGANKAMYWITSNKGLPTRAIPVKRMVAVSFIEGFNRYTSDIGHIDSNPRNCRVENLTVRDRADRTTNNRTVRYVSPEGEELRFRSVQEACKGLAISRATFYNLLHKKSKLLEGELAYFRD